jgi:phage terminase large subunit
VTAVVTKRVTRYAPRGASLRLMSCRRREVVLDGPAGTGKSHGCLMKIMLAALKYPGMRALICRQVADSLRDSTMVEWRDTVARALIESGECWYYSGSKTEAAGYKFLNGSKISIGGLDKPTKIMSRQYGTGVCPTGS